MNAPFTDTDDREAADSFTRADFRELLHRYAGDVDTLSDEAQRDLEAIAKELEAVRRPH